MVHFRRRRIPEVTAHDFVTGLKHVADGKSDGVSLIQNSIRGLDAYMTGETNDFSTVGVKALDDYTVGIYPKQTRKFLEL